MTQSKSSAKVRMFLSTFIKEVVLQDKGIELNYWPEKLIAIAGSKKLATNTVVHSELPIWLPDLGSNQGHTD
ncbi:hypothetical protein [Methylobacillus sp.]|uniref:hypothetical protein n=1 Tax=Methylobacillus sp. TaxID=56818 RepID=UPI002FE0DFC6